MKGSRSRLDLVLNDDLRTALQREAQRRQLSESAITREALRYYLARIEEGRGKQLKGQLDMLSAN